jgi:hypothetical protein
VFRSTPRLHAALLAACVVVLALQRLHTYDEPLERDLTTYAVVGHEMLRGRKLYSELWDNKSPAVYATYALGEIVAGYGPLAMFLLGVGAAVITLLGIYAAVRTSADSAAGLWAGAAWTLVSADRALQANQPNIEVFLNAALVWLFVLFTARSARPLAIGALSALASLYKLVILPLLVVYHVMHVAVAPAGSRRRAVRDVLSSVLVLIAAWAAVLGYFAATGRGTEFWQAVFAYNESFAGSLLDNIRIGLTPAQLMPPELWCALPLALLALIGTAWLIRARHRQIAGAWCAYAIGIAAAVALPGKFWPHYYQLWLPLYCIGAGIGLHAIGQWIGRARTGLTARAAARWRDAIGATALAVVLATELPLYAQSPEAWSIAKYGPVFRDVKLLAADVDALLGPDETFFEWGDETGFYYYTHRRPPSRFSYLYPIITASAARPALEAELRADLERSQPELLIVNTVYVYPGAHLLAVFQWLDTHYYRWEKGPKRGSFEMCIREGGALEDRLRRAGRL